MAPTRRSSARAPTSRVYSSAPAAPRQQHLRPKSQSIKHRSTDSDAIKKKRQSTLTQLDFAHLEDEFPGETQGEQESSEERSVEGGGSEEASSEEEQEWEQPPSKRRRTRSRKSMTESERKRQQTLTQMDGFLMHDGEDWEVYEDAMSDVQPDPLDNEAVNDQENDQNMINTHDWAAPSKRPSPKPEPRSSPRILRPRPSPRNLPSPRRGASPSSAAMPPPRTPAKPIKPEIPSSQSPAGTPLSTHSHFTPSPSKPQRTPLSEIHPNVLAMRDLETASSEKSSGKKMPQSPVPPEESQADNGQSQYSDNENYMPDSSDEGSDDEVGKDSPTKAVKHRNLKTTSIPRMGSLTPRRALNSVAASASASARVNSSPHDRADQTIRTSQASTVEFVSPRPVRRGSPLKPREESEGEIADGSGTMGESAHQLASSPPGESASQPASSPLLINSPTRRAAATQDTLPSSFHASLFKDISQVGSINDSADIVTASQVIGSSP